MSARRDIKRILVIGSGPIVIGQACEFDYSGTQAVKALKEEGYEVILLNPNPATVMTTPGMADHIYLDPLRTEYVEQIFQRERPDAILTTMGGQSGLNLALELDESGLLAQYGVEVIGSSIASIKLAEDRGAFKKVINQLGLESAKSSIAHNIDEGMELLADLPFPLIIRPSYTLGGMGGSIAYNKEEYPSLLEHALETSPTHEVLVEESLIGWKEFEMEVMRDKQDNAIIVCSIENVDPMGVHTGDSITIAPIQTLDEKSYQKMRDASIAILRAIGVDCGGSNVQFAVHPETGRMVVIEMNPRVSRSSALASKATGFPIARCSAKLAVGYTLDEVVNEITGQSVSCFEPVLDYCAVKVPRFELEKFPLPLSALGTQMRSIGEALALGRTALEALNKGIRSSERKLEGLCDLIRAGLYDAQEVARFLTSAHPLRLVAAYTTLCREGLGSLPRIQEITKFDPWFLDLLVQQLSIEQDVAFHLDADVLLKAKQAGMSDVYIAMLTGRNSEDIERLRYAYEMHPVTHHVDTCSGEFDALTPYLYTTYGETEEALPLGEDAVLILASGPNRIGQGLEFDTCCTLASMAYRKLGRKTIMVNSNPETVSTDFNISDRLYLQGLTAEEVKEILRHEQTQRVVVQLGGQTPLNLAPALTRAGAKLEGTDLEGLLGAGDRGKFSALVTQLGLRQPKNKAVTKKENILTTAREIGFPVLIRPSHVLGGRGMYIVYDEDGLLSLTDIEATVDAPVLVDQFLEDAFEYDLDAVCDGESLYVGGILQHIEAAGIHSGDSAAVFPPYKSTPELLEEMQDWAHKLALALHVKGLMNIQFAAKDGKLYLIEVNPRASRTVPFICKTSAVDLIEAAVRVWEGETLVKQGLVQSAGGRALGTCKVGWAVKEAVFSFDRFSNVDPALGPEMRSTGESIGLGKTFGEAFAKSQISSGNRLPVSGKVFISVNKKDRKTILPVVRKLVSLGFTIAATQGTAAFLFEQGILVEVMQKVHEGHPNITDYLQKKQVALVINTPMGLHAHISDDEIRSIAMRMKIPYTTTTSAAVAAVEAVEYLQKKQVVVRELTS